MKLQSNRAKNYEDIGLEPEDAAHCADVETLIEAAHRDGSLKTRPSKAAYWEGLVERAQRGATGSKWARIKLLEERLKTYAEVGRRLWEENRVLRKMAVSQEKAVAKLEEQIL